MTNSERWRTCAYHWVTYTTKEEFREHYRYCAVRVEAGYIDLDNLGCA